MYNVIEIKHLTRCYGKKKGLIDFNLSISNGEVVGLVGPNGSGKSTVLKILSTLIRPTSGTAIINGYDLFTQTIQIRNIVGYLPERIALWDEFNLAENLYYWGKLMGMTDQIEKKIKEMVKLIGLENENRRVMKFSKGMRQRVAIAQIFLDSSKVLLLDEPTSGLDPEGRFIFRKMIENYMKRGNIVILSTHDILEVAKICTYIIYMKNGRIIGEAYPQKEDVEQKYKELLL